VRLETVPLILAGFFALLGAGLLYDAWAPDYSLVRRERRRRPRAARHRGGEAMVGLGALAVAAALWGRDTWPYSNVSVIAGTVLLVFGALLNRPLLGELLLHRGAAGRRDDDAAKGPLPGAPPSDETPSGRGTRIR